MEAEIGGMCLRAGRPRAAGNAMALGERPGVRAPCSPQRPRPRGPGFRRLAAERGEIKRLLFKSLSLCPLLQPPREMNAELSSDLFKIHTNPALCVPSRIQKS